MHSSTPDSSVHEISQERILEWVAISFSRGSSQPRDQTCIFCIGRWILYHWATREAHIFFMYVCMYFAVPGLPCGMWDLTWPGIISWWGIKPSSLHWEPGVLATGHTKEAPKRQSWTMWSVGHRPFLCHLVNFLKIYLWTHNSHWLGVPIPLLKCPFFLWSSFFIFLINLFILIGG